MNLSYIPLQQTEVIPPAPVPQEEERKEQVLTTNVELVESQVTDEKVTLSVSDMRISQEAQIRHVRFNEDRQRVETTIIVKEEEEDLEESVVENEESKKQREEDDNRYFMGYFKWYWGKYGVFKAFFDFFGKRLMNGCIFSIFNSIGAAIGAFFFKRLVLSKTILSEFV